VLLVQPLLVLGVKDAVIAVIVVSLRSLTMKGKAVIKMINHYNARGERYRCFGLGRR
jgi:hypothetical protein